MLGMQKGRIEGGHEMAINQGAFSRRSFVKGSLVGVGAIAAAGLAGCGAGQSASSSASDAAASGSASGSSAGSAAAQVFDVGIGHLNSTAHLLAFVAKEEGFFEEEGINATLTQFSSGSELVAGLESEKLQIAFIGSVPTLVNQSTGHDISIFGGAMTNGHGYVIKSKYTEGLDDWDIEILKGKNVAVPRTTIQELELYQLLSAHGLTYGEDDGSDVSIVLFDSQKDAYNAMANESIDAVSTYSPYTSIAVADGHSIVFSCYEEDIFENQPCCRQVALTGALADNPELFVAAERAFIKAYAFYKDPANKQQTIKDVKIYIDIPEDEIEYEVFTPDYCDSNPDPDYQATLKLKDGAAEFGYLEDFDLSKHCNLDIYDEALASLEGEEPSNKYYADLRKHFDQYE